MRLVVEIVSDVICPWCFIGKRRFEKALSLLQPEIQTTVHWRPFELNPEMPPEGLDRKLYRTRKFGSWERSQSLEAQVAEQGAAEGIQFAFDRIERTPNTFAAHRLIWLAGEQGVQDAVVGALFHAYFVDALDLGSREVLAQIATNAGMETAGVRDFLESERGGPEVRAEELWARRQGIQGVPFFLIDGAAALSGAQRPEIIAATLQKALARPLAGETAG